MNKREAAATLSMVKRLVEFIDKMHVYMPGPLYKAECMGECAAGAELYEKLHVTQKRKPIPRVRKGPARRGPMRDHEYRKWCRVQMCVLDDIADEDNVNICNYCYSEQADAAHTENNGMRSKGPDSSCVPLCRKHHEEYDAGRAAFEKRYGVDMKALAKEHYARYRLELAAEHFARYQLEKEKSNGSR